MTRRTKTWNKYRGLIFCTKARDIDLTGKAHLFINVKCNGVYIKCKARWMLAREFQEFDHMWLEIKLFDLQSKHGYLDLWMRKELSRFRNCSSTFNRFKRRFNFLFRLEAFFVVTWNSFVLPREFTNEG